MFHLTRRTSIHHFRGRFAFSEPPVGGRLFLPFFFLPLLLPPLAFVAGPADPSYGAKSCS
jgi:hypothetical protein